MIGLHLSRGVNQVGVWLSAEEFTKEGVDTLLWQEHCCWEHARFHVHTKTQTGTQAAASASCQRAAGSTTRTETHTLHTRRRMMSSCSYRLNREKPLVSTPYCMFAWHFRWINILTMASSVCIFRLPENITIVGLPDATQSFSSSLSDFCLLPPGW